MSIFSGGRIHNKLLLSYSLLFFLSLLSAFAIIYSIVRDTITTNIESELQNTTTSIYNLVKASAAVSTKNYLRAVAEKNLEIVNHYHEQYSQGHLDEETAKEQAAQLLLSQSIGDSGYIYCLDSAGIVTVHPQSQLLQSDVSEFTFVRDQVVKKRGYLEYDWKNPGETDARAKGLYMVHFEPWDWIISVSAYRAEFRNLVNVDDFKKSVLDLRFGETGYSFVVAKDGTAIIHPQLEGSNILMAEGMPGSAFNDMFTSKSGRIVYPWKNPDEKSPRKKLCIFNYVEDYDWIVASTSYLEEFYNPLRTMTMFLLLVFALTMLLVVPVTAKLSRSITGPLQKLMQNFEYASRGDFRLKMRDEGNDEIGQLAGYFNRFMSQLEIYSSTLKQEIRVRQQVENHLRESEERYRLVLEAAADPIIIYDEVGNVVFFNPAFHTAFGWELSECIGKKMDHFVPEENWPETSSMIQRILDGKVLPPTETKRYTKSGKVLTVSISGAAYHTHERSLAGSVIILRDITETKRLTKMLMDIGDNVRQMIGQDLHDDLCPHLIGVAGLTTVLKEQIGEGHPGQRQLAEKIIELIDEATVKARGLARGLCPVHLVSHGLHSALKEMAATCNLTSSIECTFEGDESVVIKDNALATHLYYIAQEAVNNAVKHSGASRIEITLEQSADYLQLRVADNGEGMSNGAGSLGMGLQIMKYRALVIGAFLSVGSGVDGGTVIHLSMKSTQAGQQPIITGSDHGSAAKA